MSKQHNTFPGEQQEVPIPEETPEIDQPNDPKEPEIPAEDPQNVPNEVPEVNYPAEDPKLPAE